MHLAVLIPLSVLVLISTRSFWLFSATFHAWKGFPTPAPWTAIQAVSREGCRLLKALGFETGRVQPNIGLEQARMYPHAK